MWMEMRRVALHNTENTLTPVLSKNYVPAIDDLFIKTKTKLIYTWLEQVLQRAVRTTLPMSLLFCGALLGSTATCGTRPMRGEVGWVARVVSHTGKLRWCSTFKEREALDTWTMAQERRSRARRDGLPPVCSDVNHFSSRGASTLCWTRFTVNNVIHYKLAVVSVCGCFPSLLCHLLVSVHVQVTEHILGHIGGLLLE